MLRHATTGVIRSPFVGVVILGALTGCARSEHPLSSLEEGFVDPYLLGTWYEVSIESDGMIDTPAETVYEVTVGDDGYLWITGNRKNGGANVYSGHATRLGGNKFLNLRDEECRECGDLAARAARSPECPYTILQYTTFVPNGLSAELREYAEAPTHELEAWMNESRGQLVFLRGLLDEPVRESIANGEIEGETVFLDPYESMCIRSAGDALRTFVVGASEGSGMFHWSLYSRTSLRGATLDGVAIGTPRRAFVRELLEGGCRGPDTIIGETGDEITTLGYAESENDYRVKRFRFKDGRLAEITYGSPDTASVFAHAAQEITQFTHPADRRRSWDEWHKTVEPEGDFEEEQYYRPLLECIDSLGSAATQPSNTEGAINTLTDCMRDSGWSLLRVSGSSMPNCRGLEQ